VIGAELQAPDVSDAASIRARAAALKGRPIDFVISNAGLGDRADMPRPDDERFGESARQNECPDPVAGRADAETRKIAAALSSQLASIKNTDMGGDVSPAEPADGAAVSIR
jgi:hypothetical protein